MSDSGVPAPGGQRIAVIGAGVMGRGCAQVFAAAGCRVMLHDTDEEVLRGVLAGVRADLLFLAERGLGSAADADEIVARISPTPRLEEAVSEAEFVLECIPEILSVKRVLFHDVELLVGPQVILASNTSMIRITEIAKGCTHRDRVVGTHWWNPACIMPLVEIIPGEETSAETVSFAAELMRGVGKEPVLVKKDAPGFVGNRLLHALYREALSIVEQGIADPGTVDQVLKLGPGMRFPVLGPFEHMDMVGLDRLLGAYDYLFPFLDGSQAPGPLMRDKVAGGEVGFRSGGTGFQHWTPEQQRALQEGLWDYLAHRLAAERRNLAPEGQ